MTRITRSVDQWIAIGREIFVSPTDVDERIVRVIAHGRMWGGPTDGAMFQSSHEFSRGQSFAIGPNIVITLLEILGREAKFGVMTPSNLVVQAKERMIS